jgi:hypothetical protein
MRMLPLLMAAAHRDHDEAVIPKPAPNLTVLHRRSITPSRQRR